MAMITCEWMATPDMTCEEFKNMVREMFESADKDSN